MCLCKILLSLTPTLHIRPTAFCKISIHKVFVYPCPITSHFYMCFLGKMLRVCHITCFILFIIESRIFFEPDLLEDIVPMSIELKSNLSISSMYLSLYFLIRSSSIYKPSSFMLLSTADSCHSNFQLFI